MIVFKKDEPMSHIKDYIRSNINKKYMNSLIIKEMFEDEKNKHMLFTLYKRKFRMMMSFNNLKYLNELYNILKDEKLIKIRELLLFLIYKECISIEEGLNVTYNILYEIENSDNEDLIIQDIITELIILIMIEINYVQSESSFPLSNQDSIFNYVSKVFIADKDHYSYKNDDNLLYDLEKIGSPFEEFSDILDFPININDRHGKLLKDIGSLSYSITCNKYINSTEDNSYSFEDIINSLTGHYMDTDGDIKSIVIFDEQSDENYVNPEMFKILYDLSTETKLYDLLINSKLIKSNNTYIGKYKIWFDSNYDIAKDFDYIKYGEKLANNILAYKYPTI